MFIIDFITTHFVMLMELLGLMLLLNTGVHVSRRMVKTTRAAVLLLLADVILFNVEKWTQSFATLSMARPILTATVYSLQSVILIILIQLIAPLKKKQWFLLLPEALCAVLCYTSQWTKLVCWFNERNDYTGGPLSYLPYITFAFYIVVMVIQCIRYFKSYSIIDRLRIIFIILISASGAVLYMLRDYDNDYSAIFTSAILLFYLFLYFYQAKTDALTGLLNRQCFYKDLTTNAAKISAVASVDMNELKWINDSQGHDAGDKALRTIAGCLRTGIDARKVLYRIGGDEFIVFYLGKDENEVREDIGKMRAKLAQTPYVCAFGYAMKDEGAEIEDTLRKADKAMYENKSALKKEVLERGGKLHGRSDDPQV